MLCGSPSERCIIVGCLRRDLRQDYGNAEANDKDTGPGSMESVFWGEGCGSPDDWGPKDGPQVRGDLEDGCWGGNRTAAANWGTNQPINASFVTAMLKGDSGNHWTLKGGDAQKADGEQTACKVSSRCAASMLTATALCCRVADAVRRPATDVCLPPDEKGRCDHPRNRRR